MDQAGKTIADYPDFQPDEEDNVQALGNLTNFLMNTGDYKESTYYEQIANTFSYEEDQKSFALRLIIHYVGDVHQPLHATAAINDTYPSGDYGGNLEHVPTIDGVYNLHSIWDSVAYSYTGYADLPMTTSTWDYYGTEVDAMVQAYPVD